MNWRELITGIYDGRPRQPGIAGRAEFNPAASAGRIADAAAALDAALPDSLRSLLLETDGVTDMMAIDGGAWFESMWLLWTVEEIELQNCDHRAAGTRRRDFGDVVFFAGAGTDGILFAFPVTGRVCSPRVVVWHPIRDEFSDLAPSLEAFLRGWLTGTISV